jgi:hypothetical protein
MITPIRAAAIPAVVSGLKKLFVPDASSAALRLCERVFSSWIARIARAPCRSISQRRGVAEKKRGKRNAYAALWSELREYFDLTPRVVVELSVVRVLW